jgi:hypothetical protein
MKLTTLAVPTAGLVILSGFAYALPAASAATSTGHPTVADDWWRGPTFQRHFYGSVRPGVWGGQFGEPLQRLRWTSWGATSAEGHGLLVIMSCQPCYQTLHFYDAQTSHGTRYFEKAKVSGTRTGTYYTHWNGHDWV